MLSFLPNRIKSKISVDEESQCWNWAAYTDKGGYGQIWWQGKMHQAHRVVYQLLVGPIPAGLVCDHFLNNPGPWRYPCSRACVNPSHTEIVTVKINTNRGRSAAAIAAAVRGQTWAQGEKSGRAKLTTAQVLKIRKLWAVSGIAQTQLATQFGVSRRQIGRIIRRERWAHLEGSL